MDDEIKSLNTKGCKLYDIRLHTLLYADDLIMFAETKEELQMKIDKLGEYCAKWELIVGLPKTKVIIFGGGYNIARYNQFFLRGKLVEIVKFYTYF